MPSPINDTVSVRNEDVRAFIDAALARAEAADALPQNAWQCWQRAAQTIEKAEKYSHNSRYLEIADRWIALGHAMRLS